MFGKIPWLMRRHVTSLTLDETTSSPEHHCCSGLNSVLPLADRYESPVSGHRGVRQNAVAQQSSSPTALPTRMRRSRMGSCAIGAAPFMYLYVLARMTCRDACPAISISSRNPFTPSAGPPLDAPPAYLLSPSRRVVAQD